MSHNILDARKSNRSSVFTLRTLHRIWTRYSVLGGSAMPDRVGQQLGNYRLLRLLGRGGFAEVYLGEHVYLRRRTAIKVLHTSLEDEDVNQFLTEAQTLSHLTHPNIVQVFDFAVEQGIPFLAMDYAP